MKTKLFLAIVGMLPVVLTGGRVRAAETAFASSGDLDACGCRVEWTATSLTVGNGLFTRTYGVSGDVLVTRSFGTTGDARGLVRRTEGRGSLSVAAERACYSPASAEGLKVRVRHGAYETTLWLWPTVPGVLAVQPTPRPFAEPPHDPTQLSAYRQATARANRLLPAVAKVADVMIFPSRALRVTAMTLLDQTDVKNELVATREWLVPSAEVAEDFSASTLDCRDCVTSRGLVFLRLAPMPASRPQKMPDFVLASRDRKLAALETGYPLASLVYTGGDAGRIAALQALQRAVRPYRPGRDGVFLSNTWGDGNRDARINDAFLRKEIDAGAALGVDVIQIDDGWQRGRTLNSAKKTGGAKVWNGYWAADPNYWEPDRERFPQGIGPLAAAAKAKGLKFGLWFGPDSSDDAANWERDADKLLSYYRAHGIAYYKIDSLKLHSPLALTRNRAFFDKMLAASNAEMVFDLDCTAETRPGYLGLMDIGPLFVENRYAQNAGRQYRPHLTLRSLWTLSQVLDPVRLRMEVLNPAKGRDQYLNDPFAPERWPAETLFAIAMTASPLAWMELSDVPKPVMDAWKPLVATWKRERAQWHGGTIFPVGAKPDGVAWTGFLSRAADGKGGYALLFRERNAASEFTLDLAPWGVSAQSCSVLAGQRAAAWLEGSRLSVSVPRMAGFVWVKLDPAPRAFPPYASASFVPGVKGRRTGFFHCEQIDGRWWTIDPLGRGMVVLGCDGITYLGPYCEALKKSPYGETVKKKYPNKEAWNAATLKRLQTWGFNMLGNCSDEELFRRGLAHAYQPGFGRTVCLDFDDDTLWIGPTLHLPSTVFPNVFHPDFRAHCRKVAARYCAPNRDDPWLFGYFLDNELCWNGWKSDDYRGSASKSTHVHETRDPESGMFDTCLAKRKDHTARQAVEAFLDRTYGEGKRPAVIPVSVKRQFLELVAETYFSAVTTAIREADPNHMILGARFDGLNINHSKVRPEVWRAAGRYCDVLSFNCYPWADLDRGYVRRDMNLSTESIADLFAYHYEFAKKPLLITEWSFPALDAGLPCFFGAGERMLDQTARTKACALMATTVLSLPFMIGYDYFKWVDQCALGNSRAFPEDSNYGLVNVDDKPYEKLTQMFTRLHAEAGAWRTKPTPTRHALAPDASRREKAEGQRDKLNARAVRGASVTCRRTGENYEISNGGDVVWRGRVGGSNLVESVTVKGRKVGLLGGMLAWFGRNGKKYWTATTRVTAADWNEATRTLTLTAHGDGGVTQFELVYALTFVPGRAEALVELQSLTNRGRLPLKPYYAYIRQHADYAPETPANLRLNPVKAIYKGYLKAGWFAADGRYWAAATTATAAGPFRYRCDRKGARPHPDAGFTLCDENPLAPGETKSFAGHAHALLLPGLDGVGGLRKTIADYERIK